MKKYHSLYIAVFLICLAFCSCQGRKNSSSPEGVETPPEPEYLLDICIDSLVRNDGRIGNGENLSTLLNRWGVGRDAVLQSVAAADSVFDVRRLRAGNDYIVLETKDSLPQLRYFIYEESMTDFVVFHFGDSIQVYRYCKDIVKEENTAAGSIHSSLWQNLHSQGYNPMLSSKLADIYAWQIDFFGIQENDSYKVIFDEFFVDDTLSAGLGDIHAALFHHDGKNYYAIPFEQDGFLEYFDENGVNLRKAFLKAPLNYSRISSRFNPSRLHPILRIRRPHYGVDYAAPAGTPVVSIGQGVVTDKSYQKGGAGYYLKIKHNASYTTTYMHLKGFAKGIAVGSHVSQGQVIGYVGATGLATGPHLDFRVYRDGQPIDPLKMESPAANPLRSEFRDSFEVVKTFLMARLDSIQIPELTADSLAVN